MKRIAFVLALMAGSAFAGSLPYSQELKQGDTSVILGQYSAPAMSAMLGVPEALLYVKGTGVLVMVKSDDATSAKFAATVTVRIGDKCTSATATAMRAPWGYTLVFVATGAPDEVVGVTVDKIPSSVDFK